MNEDITEEAIIISVPDHEIVLDPEPDYIKLEKNLSSIGFFTATTKSIKTSKAKKITLSRTEANTRFKASVTIEPSSTHGLPTTAHQDKTLAFQKLLQKRKNAGEVIQNPVVFQSSELLQLLDQGTSGRHYQDIEEWLNVMTATLIISEGSLFLTSGRNFAKDRFHAFERATSFGKELPNGTIADQNYVWLADWLLENINNGYLVSLDFEAYKRLNNPIAKILVPLLQVWFYATETKGAFKKRYDEFCQIIGIQQYKYPSLVKQKLAPAMTELVEHGFLSEWNLESGNDGFVLELRPGEKYTLGRHDMLNRKEKVAAKTPKQKKLAPPPNQPAKPNPKPQSKMPLPLLQSNQDNTALINELILHGIGKRIANQLAIEKPAECRKQIDWLPFQNIRGNKAGFLRRAIEENYGRPVGFAEQQQQLVKEQQQKATQKALEASHSTLMGQLVQMAETLIFEHQEAISDFFAFFRETRDKALQTFPSGGRMLKNMTEYYDSEEKQLELLVTFYATHSCPLTSLTELIQKHQVEPLKEHIRSHFKTASKTT